MKTHGARGMAGRMQRDRRHLPDNHLLLVAEPIVRRRNRDVGYPKCSALHVQHFPQFEIILMQAQRRAGGFLHLAGGEEVVKMRMGVQNLRHGQPQFAEFMKDPLRRAARVHDHRLLADRVADDRAIAPERRHRKRFADQS